MKTIKDYIIERGPAPKINIDKSKIIPSNPAVRMIQTILNELSEKNDCKYEKEKNAWNGKDADLWKGAGQFLFDYMQTLDQKDLKEIVDYFGWEKWIPDINDIHPQEISVCVSLVLNSNQKKSN